MHRKGERQNSHKRTESEIQIHKEKTETCKHPLRHAGRIIETNKRLVRHTGTEKEKTQENTQSDK